MLSSALLYISGIVFNDYFDIEVDRKERPLRPLVSGIITRKKAFTIAVAAMVTADFLAFTVSIASLIVTIILSATIIGYDCRLKQTMAGPGTMGERTISKYIFGCKSSVCWHILF